MDFTMTPEQTALINVDLQNGFVQAIPDGFALVERINQLGEACRDAGVLVINTRHVLRPDGSNMGVLKNIPKIRDGFLDAGAESAALHSRLFVDPRDLHLEKPRFGAFHATDLELILRARSIDTIIVSGISTNVCCDTTAREASARDFRVFFLSDGTATPAGADLHNATLDILDGLFAQVLTVDAMLEKIASATHRPAP